MLNSLDTYLFNVINLGMQNRLFDVLMPFITDRSYVILLPVLAWLFIKDRKKALLATALSILSLIYSDWAVHIVKDVTARPRPFIVLDYARVLVGKGKAFSMPSGHAAGAFAVVIPIIIMFSGVVRLLLIVGAITVSFSRIYVGVHYPGDVLVGACIGIMSSLLAIVLYRWSVRKYNEDSFLSVLFVVLAVLSVFRVYYIFTGPLDLSPREAYYWVLSRRLDAGYVTNGPLIAYIVSMGRALFSDTVFGVRGGAVALSVVNAFVLYRLAGRMFDDRTALYAAVMSQFLPLLSIAGVLMVPGSLFIAFWTISLAIAWEITCRIEGGKKTKLYWMFLGISVGVGMLANFSMIIFYILLFLFLVSNRKLRTMLVRPYPYMGIIVSLIIFSPVIIWNAGHDWITLKFVLQHYWGGGDLHRWASNGLRTVWLSFVMITPVLFLLIWISVFRVRSDTRSGFIFFFSVPLFAFALLACMFRGVWPGLVAASCITGVIAFSFVYLKESYLLTRGMRYGVFFGLAFAVVFAVLSHYPRELRLPPDKDPSMEFAGWKDLGGEVSEMIKDLKTQGKYFIASDDCMVASELAFYTDGKPITYCVDGEGALSQYNLWPGLDDMVNYNAVVVATDDSKRPEDTIGFRHCNSRIFDVKRGKEKVRELRIFDCYDYKGSKSAES